MMRRLFLVFTSCCAVQVVLSSQLPQFQTNHYRVGVEYDHSLPMSGGADRFRHRNNYEPFFVTVTASAKSGYVISYLEVTAITDLSGEVDFCLIRGQTGSYNIVFQLVSNRTDFLSYSYMTYGVREDYYKKMTNAVTLPISRGNQTQFQSIFRVFMIFIIINYIIY